MATITINIPDAQIPRARKALCEHVGIYDEAAQTNAAAKDALAQIVKNVVLAQERNRAMAQAEQAIAPPPDVT